MPRWTRLVALLAVSGLVVGAANCAGEAGDPAERLDPGKRVSELTQEEARALCRSMVRTASALSGEAVKRHLCYQEAVSLATFADADCEELAEECLAAPESIEGVEPKGSAIDEEVCDGSAFDTEYRPLAAQCRVTVEEARACHEAIIESVQTLTEGASCASQPESFGAAPLPGACEALRSSGSDETANRCALVDDLTGELPTEGTGSFESEPLFDDPDLLDDPDLFDDPADE